MQVVTTWLLPVGGSVAAGAPEGAPLETLVVGGTLGGSDGGGFVVPGGRDGAGFVVTGGRDGAGFVVTGGRDGAGFVVTGGRELDSVL